VLAVKLADVGIGAVLGAIISGAVLLLLDQRRRSWEKQTRFLAERRLSYHNFLRYLDLLRDDNELIADFVLLLKDEKPEGDTKLSPEVTKRTRRLVDRLRANLARYQEHLVETTGTDQALLWPEPIMRAADGMLEAISKMSPDLGTSDEVLAHLDEVHLNDLAPLNRDYDRAREEFVAEVRRDLSIRT
jgi:hypothetical protein